MVFSLLFEPPGTAGGAYKKKRPAIRDELPTAGLSKPHEKDVFSISAVGVELSNAQKIGSNSEPT